MKPISAPPMRSARWRSAESSPWGFTSVSQFPPAKESGQTLSGFARSMGACACGAAHELLAQHRLFSARARSIIGACLFCSQRLELLAQLGETRLCFLTRRLVGGVDHIVEIADLRCKHGFHV